MVENQKHAGGRPLKFESVEDLQKKIDAYFAECDPHVIYVEELEYPKKKNKKGVLVFDHEAEPELIKKKKMSSQIPYTVTGLALALDTSRETLVNYESKQEFFDTIKRAKLRCENFNELMLYSNSPTGTIFNLKNNYGWKDKTETDLTNNGDSFEPVIVRIINEPTSDTIAE